MESYMTVRVGEEPTAEVVDRKSRFIAQLAHVESEQEAAAHLSAVRTRHYNARHNVPAWVLADGRERASDDGEPQRTGGMPTLEVLRGANMRDVSCVTTRYFGGTLLGTGGLVRAYTAAAQAAVRAARDAGQLVEMTLVTPVELRVPYARYEQAVRMVEATQGKVAGTDFTDEVTLHLVFRAGDEQVLLPAVSELLNGAPCVEVGHTSFSEF